MCHLPPGLDVSELPEGVDLQFGAASPLVGAAHPAARADAGYGGASLVGAAVGGAALALVAVALVGKLRGVATGKARGFARVHYNPVN